MSDSRATNDDRFSREYLDMLVGAVQLLAADSETQIGLFPGCDLVPDELALIYDDCYSLVESIRRAGLLDEQALTGLGELHLQIERMGFEEELWTQAALRARLEWDRVRQLAGTWLARRGMERQRPDFARLKDTDPFVVGQSVYEEEFASTPGRRFRR
jgi:hypothetical protein